MPEPDEATLFSRAIAAELNDARKRQRMRYGELHERTGISPRTLARVFKGESLTMGQLFLVTRALGTTPDAVWRAARVRLGWPT